MEIFYVLQIEDAAIVGKDANWERVCKVWHKIMSTLGIPDFAEPKMKGNQDE